MNTIANIGSQLERQKESDVAKAKRLEEERHRLEEEEKRQEIAQVVAAQEKLERTQKMAEEQMAIFVAKHELEAKKQALSEAQKAASNNEEDDDDNNQGSKSTAEEQQVHWYSCIFTAMHTYCIT
jgi:hypothetical protein